MKKTAIRASCFTAMVLMWLTFFSAGVLAMSVDIAEPARQTVKVTQTGIAEESGSLKITGAMPVVAGLTDLKFQTEINTIITKVYEDKVDAAAKDSAKTISFSYETKDAGEYYSIVLKVSTSNISTKDEVRTLVFGSANRLLNVNDVLGLNGVKIINRVIADEMSKKPGTYNPDFKGIQENQSFYVENGSVFVVFDKYAIGPGMLGNPVFEVNIANVRDHTFTIGKGDYYPKEPYNVKMIPVRMVCSALGFEVEWDAAARSAYVTRENFIATITMDKNIYFKNKYPALALEFAPELKDGSTYLPISFFERVLDACYTMDQAESITFSYYASK